ncbi:MAG TPA: carbohydrate-binding protein [Acidimicrobiales bacterium]|nr:carbohydrate-binding protein [Acidimicrobiales bacterium]
MRPLFSFSRTGRSDLLGRGHRPATQRRARAPRRAASVVGTLGLVAGSLASVVAASVGANVLWSAVADAGTPPAAPSGWTTLFSDDFTGPAGSTPNLNNWTYETGPGSNFGTGEIETMTNSTSNCSLDGNGDLALTMQGSYSSGWTSCRLASTGTFMDPAGGEFEMEASVKQPSPPAGEGMGYWPAFWSLGGNYRNGVSWPLSGELDPMEDVNSLDESAQHMHCGTDPGGPCNETTGIGDSLAPCPTVGCQEGFNTYAVLVNRTNTSAEYVQFLVDGQVVETINESQVGTTDWQAAIDNGFFVLFDLAMGGSYPNGVCGCTTPNASTAGGYSMLVNWVAVYATSAGQPFGGTAAAVPGTVQAANYDLGGQGVGYSVSSTNGTANSYRSDGVDLEATSDTQDTTGTGAGYDLGWTSAGQWFNYTVNVATAGTYQVSLRLASPNGVTDALHIANSAGTNLSGSVNAPPTGGWQAWTTVTADVTLPAGVQTLTVYQDNPGWNIHYLDFASTSATTTTTSTTTTTTTTTSSSSTGGALCGGLSTAGADISADCYSSSQGSITLATTSDPSPTGVDSNEVSQLSNGAYLEYPSVNFGSGATQFEARVASGASAGVSGAVNVVLDNPSNAPIATFDIANTGGWETWETVPMNMPTTTGTHNVYIEFASGQPAPYVSLHYISFP